jgi:PadR family transcriptional regulator PadR
MAKIKINVPDDRKRALLEALADSPSYGFDLVTRVVLGNDGRISPGKLYPALHALEAEGLLRSWLAPGTLGGRSRRYFALTEKGQRQRANLSKRDDS